jgi:hypothetical protein
LYHCVANFVNAQNVSIAHLQFESRLVNPPSKVPSLGGRAYAVCDPDGPIRYGDLYLVLSTLAHSKTPIKFPRVPVLPFLLISYVIEFYTIARHRYAQKWLPKLTGDLANLQPSLLKTCTLHSAYDDRKSKEELGFKAPLTSLEGICLTVFDWNKQQDELERRNLLTKKESAVKSAVPPAVPA